MFPADARGWRTIPEMNRLLLPLFLVLAACSTENTPPEAAPDLRVDFDFTQGAQDWVAGFADYGQGQEEFYELTADYRALPPELGADRSALFISGRNYSDDLFMFYKRRIDGLKPGGAYHVRFEVQIATEVPSGCAGAGGSPGEDVFLKAGASDVEPIAVAEGEGYRMNIDKGNQSVGGTAALVLGNIANSRPCDLSGDFPSWDFELKTLESGSSPFFVTADENGAVWLLVGTDSGFEGTTRLYYTQFSAGFFEN